MLVAWRERSVLRRVAFNAALLAALSIPVTITGILESRHASRRVAAERSLRLQTLLVASRDSLFENERVILEWLNHLDAVSTEDSFMVSDVCLEFRAIRWAWIGYDAMIPECAEGFMPALRRRLPDESVLRLPSMGRGYGRERRLRPGRSRGGRSRGRR